MEPVNSVAFAAAARTLTAAARRRGLTAPSYRSPPRLVGVDRSLRRRGQAAVVSVRLRGRPWPAILADMVEGVVVANRLGPPDADRVRAEMWAALERSGSDRDPAPSGAGVTDANRPATAARSGGRPAGVRSDVGVSAARAVKVA